MPPQILTIKVGAIRQQICVMLAPSQLKKRNKKKSKLLNESVIPVTDEDNILIG